jgi:hypothetical protein
MNKRLVLPISFLLMALFLSSCGFQVVVGSGNVTTVTRTVGEFSAVKLAGIGDIIITQEETPSLRIEVEDNLLPYFDTSVVGDTLVIGLKTQYIGVNLRPTKPIKFYVSTPKLEGITLAGSGNIITSDVKASNFKAALLGSGNITNDSLTADSADLRLSGSGNISFGKVTAHTVDLDLTGSGNFNLDEVAATDINSTISGSGNITLAGKVAGQTAKILGSGEYRAGNLESTSANIRVTGSGKSQVNVSDTLNVAILGSGDVIYAGHPTVNSSTAGSGRVKSSD